MAAAPVPCLGVDLGATNGVVAVSRGASRVDVVANDHGSRTTPCVVGFLGGDTLVAEAARDLPPRSTLFDAKLLLGRTLQHPAVQSRLPQWPFRVSGDGGALLMTAAGGSLSPTKVTELVLRSLKETADAFLAEPASGAVITVPPYFCEAQRAAVAEAGAQAGLRVEALLCEAEAAAAAYSLGPERCVLVLCVGGRSAYAWLRKPRAGATFCKHDCDLGGRSFDQRLVDFFTQDIRARHGVDLDEPSVEELRRKCELTKRKLSSLVETSLLMFFPRFDLEYKAAVTRARFEDLCADLFRRTLALVHGVLAEAQVDSGGVHDVVLAGGSAAIPRVRGLLREAFAFRGDQLLRCSINSAEVAAHGAALHAARLRAAPLSAEVVLREEGDGGGGEEEEEEGEREEERRRRREEERRRRREEERRRRREEERREQSSRKEVVLRERRESRRAVGFDLGTTYSAVAVCRKGRVEVLANDSGERTTPSVVAFLGGESFVGEAARDLPAACQVFDAKRLIGRSWKDLDVQADRKHWPFDVVMVDGVPKIKLTVDGKTEEFAPEEISALVLKALKETADDFLDETVTKAVITVPAYFNERQRQATKDAGRIAGLDVLAMINEPTAAAIAYGLDRGPRPGDDKKTVFIYDLGGGTFDVSIVTVEGSSIAVLASGGDTHLGGQDFDVRLLNHFTEDIHSKHGVELDVQAVQDLRRECEMAKRKLSAVAEATVSVFLARFNFGYKGTISRARFEDLCADLFKKTVDIATAVLADAELERGAVDEVVLVGGSTRIPKVRALLRELFAKEPRHSINPDEAVAHGAAVHAAVLSGDAACSRLVQLRDVTPLSLGVDIVGGLFLRVIPRNTAVPCRRTKEFYTVYDDQQTVDFEVFQGERELVKDNHSLNKEFSIAVPARPKGEVKMDMTFELDHDGLLTVTCVERSTGETRQVVVTQEEARLTDDDIKAMMEKAERFRLRDREARERIEQQLRDREVLF